MPETEKPKVCMKRRKQVKSACSNCRKSKTACSTQRPCTRCVSLGITDTCKDVPRKQREKKQNKELEGEDSFKLFVFDQNPTSEVSVQYNNRITPISQELGYPLQRRENYSNQSFSVQPVFHSPNYHWNSSPEQSSYSSPSGDEKSQLYAEIEMLKRKMKEKDDVISTLQTSLRSQIMFTNFSMSYWKLRTTGICVLQTFSEGFVSLIKSDPRMLHDSSYTCIQMYPSNHLSKTVKLFDLVASGRVESFVVRLPLVCGNGDIVSVYSVMKIEFNENIPSFLTMCMQEYDPPADKELPYFEATLLKLRNDFMFPSFQPPRTPIPPPADEYGKCGVNYVDRQRNHSDAASLTMDEIECLAASDNFLSQFSSGTSSALEDLILPLT